jgi:hypothetical protein
MCPLNEETEFDTTEQTAGMDRAPKSALAIAAFLFVAAAIVKATAGPSLATLTGITPEMIAQLVTPLIAEAVPREFEGEKDWGKTKTVTSGLHNDGNFFKFDIHRQTSEVNDGIWKKYRVTLIEPEKNLEIRIDDMHHLESGKYALTLFVAAKVHGWARAVVYEHSVHVISLDAEGDTSIRLWVDAEVGVETVESSTFIPGLQLQPVVTDARLKFDDFKLNRISDVHGKIANELGDLLQKEMQKKLSGPKLVDRFNHALQKHPERLRLSPDMLLGKSSPKKKDSLNASPR